MAITSTRPRSRRLAPVAGARRGCGWARRPTRPAHVPIARAFRQLLRATGPAVVVVWVPPATAEEIGDVAAARRVRRDLRAILIDRPAGERRARHRAALGL